MDIIHNEDCLDTMKRMEAGSIDLVVTSPPYFNARDYSQYDSVTHYRQTMTKIFTDCYRILKPAHFCVVNISPVIVARLKRSGTSRRLPLPHYMVVDLENIGFDFIDDIIWLKPDGAAINRIGRFTIKRRPRTYRPNAVTENILVFQKPAPYLVDRTLKDHSVIEHYDRSNVWEMQPDTNNDHPAPYPLQLPSKIIRYYSYENEIVYDPFMGSGTTARAALNLNRHYIGSEVSAEYCAVAEKRLAQTMLV